MRNATLCSVISFCFITQLSFAQPTWTEDIAQIFFDNCTTCHHEGGIAPFALMTYEQTLPYANQIHEAVEHRSMPPWPADPSYRHFKDELYLSNDEIQAIQDWIHEGSAPGNLFDLPPTPVYGQGGSLLESIDHVVAIEPYQLQSNTDEYRWFVIPTDFTETVYISHLEVIAGLENVVHHADIAYDLTGHSLANDLADPLPGFNSSTGGPNYNYYINAWQPGGNIATYPENWGIAVPPGSDFVIEIHYGPGGQGQIDSTKIHLQFIKNPAIVRPVEVSWLLSDSPPVLLDGPLVIPANEVKSFHQRTAPLQEDLSLISICPHMHFLGKSYKVWAIPPSGDTIQLIDIPHWDFHWQRYYEFPQIIKLPKGTVIESEGWYDNTTANHDNPNNPPVTAYRGTKTTDEMFLCYFIYAPYETGDENIILDSTLILPVRETLLVAPELSLFPNPASDFIYIKGNLPEVGTVNYRVIDSFGQEVLKFQGKRSEQEVEDTISIEKINTGFYFLTWESGEHNGAIRFLKK